MAESKDKREAVKEYALEFVREFVEAMAIMTAVYLIMERPFDVKILKVAFFLSLLSTAMHVFDEESHAKMKEGMKAAVGNTVVASAFGRVAR